MASAISTTGRVAFALALASSLSACQMGVDVTVSRIGGAVRIVATRAGLHLGKTAPPCINSVTVYPAGVDQLATRPLWSVSGYGKCADRFTYGRMPAGWSGDAAAPLIPGRRYEVQLGGPGFTGAGTFLMRADDGPMHEG